MIAHQITNPKWANAANTVIECTVIFELTPAIPGRAAVAAIPAVPAVVDADGDILAPAKEAVPAVAAIPDTPATYSDPLPFAATLDDVESHGIDIYHEALAMGPAAYVAPPTPVPYSISDRQFAQRARDAGLITQSDALAFVRSGVIPATLQAIIDALPTQQAKDNAELTISGATIYERNSPLTIALGTAFAAAVGAPDASAYLDQFFIAAAAL